MTTKLRFYGLQILLICLLLFSEVYAEVVYKTDQAELNVNIDALFGVFHSQESYALARDSQDSQNWQEGYVKYGLSGSHFLNSGTQVYGGVRLISTATWGDGDAVGFTTGTERRTNFEDAYAGWKSGELFSFLGKDGIDVSAGRQTYTIGNGFLLYGDAVNYGKGFDSIAPKSMDRGGVYYLAARQTFEQTAIIRLGQSKNLHGDIFWLNSNNESQAKTELAGLNIEYKDSHYGTLGLTYLKGLSVDKQLAEFLGYTHRDGQNTVSIRGNGSLGVENLSLSAEYAHQDIGFKKISSNGNDSYSNEKAWYLEADWTFADIIWKPNLGVRYSSFSSGFDPLFYGVVGGYGTWFQGEIAGSYAGPFNSNAEVSHLYLKAQPLPSLSLGLLFFDFQTKNKRYENLDATEWDAYAVWEINEHLSVIPLIGFYTPSKSADQGGSQLGNDNTNVYSEITVSVSF